MQTISYDDCRHNTVLGCYSCCSIMGIVVGSVVIVTFGSTCGIGYLIVGAVSGATLLLLRQMKVHRDIAKSADLLKHENVQLKSSNEQYNILNQDLEKTNESLEVVCKSLSNDVDDITASIRDIGESTDKFMLRFRSAAEAMKLQNNRHKSLNQQQAKFQLLQICRHFDFDSDFALSKEELDNSFAFFEHTFPGFRLDQLQAALNQGAVTFMQLEKFIPLMDK